MFELLLARQQFYQRADWTKATADYVAEHDIDLAAVNAYAGLITVTDCTFPGNGHFTLADEGGKAAAVIEVLDEDDETIIDLAAWPVDRPDAFATMFDADALGMARVVNPATWAFGGVLNVWRTPLRWLQAGCQGCVILDHRNVASWLREALGPIEVEDVEHAKQVEAMLNLPPWPRKQILVPRSPERRAA